MSGSHRRLPPRASRELSAGGAVEAAPALILVADDDEQVRSLATRVLADAGYEVAAAAEGRQALRLAHRLKPSLVVLDVDMPGLSGLEVARRIRATKTIAQTPILVASAGAGQSNVAAAIEAGADAYLVKPFKLTELLALVRLLLERSP